MSALQLKPIVFILLPLTLHFASYFVIVSGTGHLDDFHACHAITDIGSL